MQKRTVNPTNNATEITSFEVLRARQLQNGHVTFDVKLNGISIYGCFVVEGKNGDFISFPQRLGSDGKYYSIAWCRLSNEVQKSIIETIEGML